MLARLAAVLPRFALIAIAGLLASAAVTFAATNVAPTTAPAPAAQTAADEPDVIVVPDVRNQAYVFAKGTLADAGLAWKLSGAVEGYAAHLVTSQSPAPGTRLVDTGAPLVTLELAKNPTYAEKGEPENASPYAGTRLRLAPLEDGAVAASAPAPAEPAPAAAKPKQPAKAKKKAAKAKADVSRAPAFSVPGAPAEPLDEIPLHVRAQRLATWLEQHREPTPANVRHWLYQHNWIVTGASFGWSNGEQALEILLRVDRRVESLWGLGSKSRAVTERTLTEVRERSR